MFKYGANGGNPLLGSGCPAKLKGELISLLVVARL